jgi:hypothetical protein
MISRGLKAPSDMKRSISTTFLSFSAEGRIIDSMPKRSGVLPPVPLKKPAALIKPLKPVPTLKPGKAISTLKKVARGGGR